MKKIIKNKYVKSILRFLGIIYIKTKDQDSIVSLKKDFFHSERSFYYKKMKYMVDCLYCHASPGTMETIIMEALESKKTGKILNLGGGNGQVSEIFDKLGYNTINIDIEVAKENEKNIKFDLNSDKDLPFEKKSFDIIICQEIIEHIENPWKLLRLAKEYLTDEGIIFLTTPNIQSQKSKKLFTKKGYFEWFSPDCLSYHINPIPFWEIELISKRLGLKIEKLTGSGEYYFRRNKKQQKIIDNNETLIFVLKKQN